MSAHPTPATTGSGSGGPPSPSTSGSGSGASATPSTGSEATSPSPSWAGKIENGDNYRVIRGKKSNSNIIVAGDKCYRIEKTTPDKSSEEMVRYVYYLRCQDHNCLGTALIRTNILTEKTSDLKRHTCGDQNSTLDKIAIQEALNRMKKRAREEGTTYYVRKSPLISFNISHKDYDVVIMSRNVMYTYH